MIWLRELGWAAAFLAVLAILLFPAIFVSAAYNHQISLWEQGGLILVATLVTQFFRGHSVFEVTGPPGKWGRDISLGVALGAALMTLPALFLLITNQITFEVAGASPAALFDAVLLMAGVAIAEELLFRGVLFQRLTAALGIWPAQCIVAWLFMLTHLNNPGMLGATKLWAATNIFLASIMFGLAYMRTRSLALPIGMHFMANIMQGTILGFGVSGEEQATILRPVFNSNINWLTGGKFGLEASLPGLIAVALLALWLAAPSWMARRMRTMHEGTPS